MKPISRRKLITTGLAATAGAVGLAEAARLAAHTGIIPPDCAGIYGPGETLNYATSRLVTEHTNAREFPRSMISARPFANEIPPLGPQLERHKAANFVDWKLTVDGLVEHPMQFSVADLKALGQRSQITEIGCEEGWTYIAEWIGTPLSDVLQQVRPLPSARYLVYFSMQPGLWGSIDMPEAMHPQTQLSWGMNGGDLPFGFGGPLRIRIPRQLGYKNLKYISHLTVADSMKHFGKGLGSVDPEGGYSWYAGI